MALQIKTELKEISSINRELSVVIAGADVARELDRAYRQLSQRVTLKGFRKGKVPRSILEQYYKADTENEVANRLVGESFDEAQKSLNLAVVSTPSVKAKNPLLAGQDFTYDATFEVKPTIELKDYAGLEVKRDVYVTDEADIETELKALQNRQAKVIGISDRTDTQKGDLADINFSGTIEGEPVKGLSGFNYTVEVGSGEFYAEIDEALVGKNIGDKFEIEITVPADFVTESARGQKALVAVNVLGLKQKVLPAIDDEFAKDVGDQFENLEQLKERLRDELQKGAENRTRLNTREAVVQALIDNNGFDVPSSLVDREAERMAAEQLQRFPEQQREAIWRGLRQTLMNQAKPVAEKRVRSGLILEVVVEKAGITIGDDDIQQRLQTMAVESRIPLKTLVQFYGKPENREEIRGQLSYERAIDAVLAAVTLVDEQKRLLDDATAEA